MTATVCTHCGAKAQLFLCPRCTNTLRSMLTDLPQWLDWLTEAATGQTRLGQSARRSSDKGSPALCRLGPKGDFADSPSEILERGNAMLVEWVRDICETRGATVPTFGPVRHTDARDPVSSIETTGQAGQIAVWLAERVTAIAADPGAAVCHAEIAELTKDIERAINRPTPPRVLGPCPAPLTDGYGTRVCNVALTAHRDAIEVQCPACKSTHDVEKLASDTLDTVRDQLYTQAEILHLMAAAGQPVPLSTWRHWCATGKVFPRNDDLTAEPRYWLVDAMQARAAKPQKNTTGAARHKRKPTSA